MLLKKFTYQFSSQRVLSRLIVALLLLQSTLNFAQVQVSSEAYLMGSYFMITVVDKDSISAKNSIKLAVSEIDRIENLISEWRPETQISQVNKNSGISPIKVSKEVFDLTNRAINYSIISNGAFDISIASLDKVWRFDGTLDDKPTPEIIQQSVRLVGYKNIQLDSVNQTIYLAKAGMKIGFGSIGKGYAADQAKEVLMKNGVKSGLVNASGDIACWGKQLDGKPWLIGITNPYKTGKFLKKIRLNDGAVTTSGSYTKFVEFDNVRFSHIINPTTGMPATGLTSVTVYGPSAEIANALSTSIMVLGKKNGRKLLKKFPNYRAFLLKDK